MGLDYNTEREKLKLPEYGRNVLKMVRLMKCVTDRQKRSEQAAAIVKVMEILNPHAKAQEDYLHKLWDQLYILAGTDLDVDSPFPPPSGDVFETRPVPIPMKGEKIKALHYGRNIEKMIDLVCEQTDEELRKELIRSLATYMRQQYLIWNKDSVADDTIFSDIERLSEGRIAVPEGIVLDKISLDANYSRPGTNGNQQGSKNKSRKKSRKR